MHPRLYTRDEWSEEDGEVLWWSFPIRQPPCVGEPDDVDPDHYTHFTTIPAPINPNRDILERSANVGYDVDRCSKNWREAAFAREWAQESEPRSGVNHGQGLAQNLFMRRIEGSYFLDRSEHVHKLTDHERRLLASAIQWLGTNCGMSFLETVLKKAGFKLEQVRR